MMRVFSLENFQLHGANLIEASAGTGKTYTISALYLRLILEKGLPIAEILVVTFTRAATAELKLRLRDALVAAQRFIQTGQCADETLVRLFERAIGVCAQKAGNDGRSLFLLRVEEALRAFDEASIFTIHGFCQRVIKNNALLAQCEFDLELVSNQDELYESVIYDYWRQHILPIPHLAQALQAQKMLPDESSNNNVWKQALKEALRNSDAIVDWLPIPSALTSEDVERIHFIFDSQPLKEYLAHLDSLLESKGFNQRSAWAKNPLAFQEAYQAWMSLGADEALGEEARRLTRAFYDEELTQKLKKGFQINDYPTMLDELDVLYERSKASSTESRCLMVLRDFYEKAPELYRQKQSLLGVTTYDDMLLGLLDALKSRNGEALARALSKQYRAALIDEFQDTDGIQYGIFNRIFMQKDSSDTFVCFVGDPKQSIYRFRGADIQTYLSAREDIDVERRFTLDKNYRSTSPLIDVVNRLFSSETAFGHDGKISYQPVQCGNLTKTGLMKDGKALSALKVTMLRADDQKQKVFEYTAKQVADYLRDEKVEIDGRRVQAKDLAVLVRSRDQVQSMQHALRSLGIESRVVTEESIYDSVDAQEVLAILRAVAKPRDAGLLKTALATRIFGLDAQTIYQIGVDEVGTADVRATLFYWQSRFDAYRELWLRKGAGFLLTHLIDEEKTLDRWLSDLDGSRRLTNLYHLIEELYAMSFDYRQPEALLENFGKKAQTLTEVDEESADVLRMESDDNIVTIMTYHKSKGLEFPIVLLPMVHDLKVVQNDNLYRKFEAYVDDHDGKHISVAQVRRPKTISLYHPNLEPIREQFLAEQVRLFYVAVTRASRRLELIDGQQKNSVVNYLFNGQWESMVEEGLAEPIVELMIDDESLELQAPLKEDVELIELATPARHHAWKMTSYSNMVNRIDREKDHQDEVSPSLSNNEVIAMLASAGVDQSDIIFFPRGAEAGEALHLLMETIDFTDSRSHAEKTLSAIERYFSGNAELERYCVSAGRMVRDLLDTDLGQGWCLSEIDASKRISELEFLMSMQSANATRLVQRIRAEGLPAYQVGIAQAETENLFGYLKGFMDLVVEHDGRFYIIDWKSNFLTSAMPQPQEGLTSFLQANYSQSSMCQAIVDHGYALQYLLYTVALHRMLRQRLGEQYSYEQHFGGVYYLFVRGVRANLIDSEGKPCGIWYDRPSRELIEELDAILGAEQ